MRRFLIVSFSLIILFCGCDKLKKKNTPPPENINISKASNQHKSDRKIWLDYMDKLAGPVLNNLANDQLKINMPVQLSSPDFEPEIRTKSAYLEAFGRLMSGIGPWLALAGGNQEEILLRNKYRALALKAISNAVNPAAKDYMEWDSGSQRLVDASFLAFAFLRSPWLWDNLPDSTRERVITVMSKSRSVNPVLNNWILNSGMIEAFMCHYGLPYDKMRVDYILREFERWYVGDGMYADGPFFHWDYYNSIVIHPFLTRITEEILQKNEESKGKIEKLKASVKGEKSNYEVMMEKIRIRNNRYSIILERLINTDGTYPVIGRSLVYRGGAFHHLSDMAMRKELPPELSPAQVRSALTAVILKTTENPNTFNSSGWLNIGIYGTQPALADVYVTTGSLYMCTTILVALGLPESDEFWSSPPQLFTSQKIWRGENGPHDHNLED